MNESIHISDGQEFTFESLKNIVKRNSTSDSLQIPTIISSIPPFIETKQKEYLLLLKKECNICYNEYKFEKNIIILSCGHDYCIKCAMTINTCGFCKKPIIKI